jgi:hypothetical protein
MALSNAARASNEIAVVHIKAAKFFVVSGRRIVANRSFQFVNALAAREDFEGLAEQSNVGKRLHKKIDDRAQRTEKQDDKNPVGIRPAPDEVDDRQSLQDETPRIEKR